MKTETMLMGVIAFLIGWFLRKMMGGLVEGQTKVSECILNEYDHLQTKGGQKKWSKKDFKILKDNARGLCSDSQDPKCFDKVYKVLKTDRRPWNKLPGNLRNLLYNKAIKTCEGNKCSESKTKLDCYNCQTLNNITTKRGLRTKCNKL